MKRLELLDNPVFKSAPPTSCLFYDGRLMGENMLIGIGDLSAGYSCNSFLSFHSGVPVITKEEMEKVLKDVPCNRKTWNPEITLLMSDCIYHLGECNVVLQCDHTLVLKPVLV